MARKAKDKRWKTKLIIETTSQKPEVSPDLDDSGVHLDEPSTSSQAWENDLDFFIQQLSDPKAFQNVKLPQPLAMHHRQSMGHSSNQKAPSGRVLSSSQSEHLISKSGLSDKRLSMDMDKKCTLVHNSSSSTSSNCRRLSWRSGKSTSCLKDVKQIELRNIVPIPGSQTRSHYNSNDDDDLGIDDDSPPISPQDHVEKIKVTFTCDSSPEVSDEDIHSSSRAMDNKDHAVNIKKDKESKKSRFRKMITRPLRRSCSAGNPKDVPAYALFLQFNPGSLPEKSAMSECPPAQKAYSEPHVSEVCEGDGQHKPVRKVLSDDPAGLGEMSQSEELSPPSSTIPKSNSRSKLARHMKRKLQFLRRRHTDTALGESTAKFHQQNKMSGGPTRDDALRWSCSFENLLSDKNGLELFRDFLRSEFSEENVEFWIACENYKHSKSNRLSATAQKIYADFVAVHAPKEINLDSKTRMATISNMTSLTRKTFEEAQKRIQALMEKDSYPRFLESEIYNQIMSNHRS